MIRNPAALVVLLACCACATSGGGTDGAGDGDARDEAGGEAEGSGDGDAADVDGDCDPAGCDDDCVAGGAEAGVCRAGVCECIGGADADADADIPAEDGAGEDADAGDAEAEDAGPDGASIDDDGDTVTEEDGDCDDTDPRIHPGATEHIEGVDYDCDFRIEYLATIIVSVDDAYEICVDGVALGTGSEHRDSETYQLVLDAGSHVVGIHGHDTAGVTAGLAAWIGVAGMEVRTDGVRGDEPDTTKWRYYPNEVEDPQATWCDVGFDDSGWGPALFAAEHDDGEWLAEPYELRGRDVEWVWDGRPRDLREAWFRRRIELPNDPRPAAAPGVDVCTTAGTPVNLILGATEYLHNGVALAWTGTEFGAVWDQWHDPWRAGCDQLFLQRVSADGAPLLDPPTQLTTGTWWNTFPDVAWGASTYGIVNEDGQVDRSGDQIYLVRADASGAEVGSDVALTASPTVYAGFPAIAFDGTNFGAAWEDDRDGGAGAFEIYFARVSPAGTPLGAQLRLTDAPGASRTPDVSWGGSQWGVVWEDVRDGDSEVYFSRVSAAGAEVGVDVPVSSSVGESTAPAIAWSGAAWGVAWADERDGNREIYFATVDSDGLVGPPTRVTVDGAGSSNPSIVWDGSGWTLAWRDGRDGNDEIYLTRLDAAGARIDDDTRVTDSAGRSWHPELVWSGTQYALLWEEETAPAAEPYRYRPMFQRVSCP